MILGVTGTNGSGKGEVVRYLTEQRGFKHYSSRQFIVEELKRQGRELNRTNMRLLGTELRDLYSHDYLPRTFIADATEKRIENYLIESIRHSAEASRIRQEGGYIIAVDADSALRYKRVLSRGTETDRLSFEEFKEQEEREMHGTTTVEMDMRTVMENADYTILNNDGISDLHAHVDEVLEKIRHR